MATFRLLLVLHSGTRHSLVKNNLVGVPSFCLRHISSASTIIVFLPNIIVLVKDRLSEHTITFHFKVVPKEW